MNKILLVGELGDIVRSINECLMDDFQIQLCSEQIDMVKAMAKIVKPELIIVCHIGSDELDGKIFGWAKEEMPRIPVLVISTDESYGQISRFCNTGQFDKLFRPVTAQEMVEKCRTMIATGVRVQSEEEMSEEVQTEESGLDTEVVADDPKSEQSVENVEKQELPQYKIMIVDDSPLVLRNLKGVLEDTYKVFVVPSGEKALELIPKKQPDLVLLDYEMPGLDGKDVFEAMLADDGMKNIPVIFLTSISQREQVYGVLKSVPAGYILKPADTDRLMAEISKVLKNV